MLLCIASISNFLHCKISSTLVMSKSQASLETDDHTYVIPPTKILSSWSPYSTSASTNSLPIISSSVQLIYEVPTSFSPLICATIFQYPPHFHISIHTFPRYNILTLSPSMATSQDLFTCAKHRGLRNRLMQLIRIRRFCLCQSSLHHSEIKQRLDLQDNRAILY